MAGFADLGDVPRSRVVLLVVIVVLALGAAVYSITRTVKAGQGESKGTLPGWVGKKEMMERGQSTGEEPTGQGESVPAVQTGPAVGGKPK